MRVQIVDFIDFISNGLNANSVCARPCPCLTVCVCVLVCIYSVSCVCARVSKCWNKCAEEGMRNVR